jgi:hypothetical protein
MKKIIIAAIILIAATSAKAQIEVYDSASMQKKTIGKLKAGFISKAELNYYIDESDTVYSILFRNAEYTSIVDYQSIDFSGGQEVVDQLYSVIKTFFSEENKKNKEYKRKLKLGEKDVSIHNYRTMGVTNVMIWVDKSYFYLTEKETDKLFGKVTEPTNKNIGVGEGW